MSVFTFGSLVQRFALELLSVHLAVFRKTQAQTIGRYRLFDTRVLILFCIAFQVCFPLCGLQLAWHGEYQAESEYNKAQEYYSQIFKKLFQSVVFHNAVSYKNINSQIIKQKSKKFSVSCRISFIMQSPL